MECDERISREIVQRLKYELGTIVGAEDEGEHKIIINNPYKTFEKL